MRVYKLKKMRLPEQIAYVLKKEIFDGVYNQTMQLPSEREIALSFGTSRLTVRGALTALQREGWIRIEQGRKSVINSIDASLGIDAIPGIIESTPEFLNHSENAGPIIQYALWVHQQIPIAAAKKAKPHDRGALLSILDDQERETLPEKFFINDVFFNRQLLRISRNFPLNTLYNSLVKIVNQTIEHSSIEKIPYNLTDYLKNKRDLVSAICQNDRQKVQKITAEYLPHAQKAYKKLFNSIDMEKHGR